mmetsp:Transcript_9776/g.33773  ORF Transcript_9776/g.33773 Transcript_9776/m.33773 type:complete len:273 (-) Transcript_9776:488-1306(-)
MPKTSLAPSVAATTWQTLSRLKVRSACSSARSVARASASALRSSGETSTTAVAEAVASYASETTTMRTTVPTASLTPSALGSSDDVCSVALRVWKAYFNGSESPTQLEAVSVNGVVNASPATGATLRRPDDGGLATTTVTRASPRRPPTAALSANVYVPPATKAPAETTRSWTRFRDVTGSDTTRGVVATPWSAAPESSVPAYSAHVDVICDPTAAFAGAATTARNVVFASGRRNAASALEMTTAGGVPSTMVMRATAAPDRPADDAVTRKT